MIGLLRSAGARSSRILLFLGLLCAWLGSADAADPIRTARALKESRLLDLTGAPADPFNDARAKLFAFVFTRTDCPISNRYAPEIQRLQAKFALQGVVFYLVYPGADESPELIRDSLRAFHYSFGALRDPSHSFAKKARVTVTPECAVFAPGGRLLYHGRIDDRYADFGKSRPEAARHDLSDALTQALAGKPVAPSSGPAIGCFIEEEK